MNNTRLYEFLTILVIGLFCYYTYSSIISLGYIGEADSTSSILKLSVVGVSLLTVLISGSNTPTKFTRFWWSWIIWLLIDFFVLGLRGNGVSNVFSVTFAPMSFLFFYTVSSFSENVTKIATVGFLVLFSMAFVMNLSYLSFSNINIFEESGITNLVYWCLCAVPFIFLIKKKWLEYFFQIAATIVILVTGKRSAFICLVLILIAILFFSRKQDNNKKSTFFVLLGGVGLLLIVNHYFSSALDFIFGRMGTIQETQGTNRIPLYHDVLNVLDTNSFIDWIVGRGYGSITITKHTNAHNDALQMLFEYGIVGLFFYLAMLWNAVRVCKILYRNQSHYFMGYVVSLIIFVVLGMVSDLVVFYSYFAFICAYWGIAENEVLQIKHSEI